MNKIAVERKDGSVWRQIIVKLHSSHKGNLFFRLEGNLYVLKNLKEGTTIIMYDKANAFGPRWVKAGRVVRGIAFLGDGESYSEHNDRIFKEQHQTTWIPPSMTGGEQKT